MRTFKVRLVSQANTIISLLIFFGAIFLFITFGNYVLPKKLNAAFPLIFTVILLLFIYSLFQKLARAWTEWTIDEIGIKIHWTTQFAFTHKTDAFINWNEIDSYKMPSSTMYTGLKIYLKSGDVLTFYHHTGQKDNFNELILAFKTMYNKSCS